MVKVILDEYYITFEIKNDNIGNDLKKFYSTDYFEFIGLNPEIFLRPSGVIKGGFSEYNNVTVPYKYFAKFVDNGYNISIKNIKMPEVYIPVRDYLKNVLNKNNNAHQNDPDKIDKDESDKSQGNNTENIKDDDVEDKDDEPEDENKTTEDNPEDAKNPTDDKPEDENKTTEDNPEDAKNPTEDEAEDEPNNKIDDEDGNNSKSENKEYPNQTVKDKNDLNEDKSVDTERERGTKMGDKKETFEIITIKIRLNETSSNVISAQSLPEILKINKELKNDNVEMNSNGLTYQDIESIYKIKKYLEVHHNIPKITVYQEEIYRINGKYIIIKENEIVGGTNIDKIDVSNLENTFLMKLYL